MALEEPNTVPRLTQLASKRFPAPLKFPFTAYSHCHDLLAIVTANWDVSVFRITSGQLAFTVKQRVKDVEVTAVSWKADGTCLGVGWSDGHYGIYDGGTGKEMQVISLQPEGGEEEKWMLDLRVKEPPPPPLPGQAPEEKPEPEPEPEMPEPARVGCFGWMGHLTSEIVRRRADEKLSTDDWYDGLEDDEDGHEDAAKKDTSLALTNLPQAITTLDITKVLPRLSTIPTHLTPNTRTFGSLNKFGSQQATDNLFQTRDNSPSDLVQSILVCQDDGLVQVLLDETVKIGSSNIPGKPVMHTAHPQSPTHAILSESEDSGLYLSFMDLPLQSLGGPILHVIATNTKRIQTLLEYVVQCVRCIEHDYTTSIAFPQKMMNSLSGFLESEVESDPVLNLFHLAMTGAFSAPLQEWFTEILKDRHQKAWEQTMNIMYNNLQNHIFMNLLPALDRFSTALTKLRGLANFYEGSTKFDCPPELFTNILEHIDSLRLIAQRMQLIVQTEHRQFRAFYKWAKMEVDIGIAGPLSSSALETEEREVPNLDYSLILPYIKDTLTRSKLAPHLETRPGMEEGCNKEEFFGNPIIRDLKYERTKEVLEKLDKLKGDDELKMKDIEDPIALLNLPAITCGLTGHVRVALKRITEWQSRMLSRPTSIPLNLEPGTSVHDMKTSPRDPAQPSQQSITRLLALHPDAPNQLHITEVLSPISTNSKRPSSSPTTPSPKMTQHAFPSDGQILSAKWIPTSDTAFLTLFKSEDNQTSIIKHTMTENGNLPFDSEVLQIFPDKGPFRPLKLVVGGRKGKLICVAIGNKGREWRVFDLDAGVQPPDEEAGAEDNSEDTIPYDDMEMEMMDS